MMCNYFGRLFIKDSLPIRILNIFHDSVIIVIVMKMFAYEGSLKMNARLYHEKKLCGFLF